MAQFFSMPSPPPKRFLVFLNDNLAPQLNQLDQIDVALTTYGGCPRKMCLTACLICAASQTLCLNGSRLAVWLAARLNCPLRSYAQTISAFFFCREWGGMDSCPRCCIRRKGDAARIRRRILRSLPEAERKSAQDRNCVWRTDRQKNSNGNT